MTFGAKHYVPVLKLKQGEKKALESLHPVIAKQLTPLLEVVENKAAKAIDEHLGTGFKGLPKAVKNVARYFLDTREVPAAGVAEKAFALASAIGRPFVPVTGISRILDVGPALEAAQDGVALRITREEFETGLVEEGLPEFMKTHSLEYAKTDLLCDLGPVEDMISDGIALLSGGFLSAVPYLKQWRSLTLLASSFPKGLGQLSANTFDFENREEWISWRDSLHANRANFERLPTFGDCAIQHPKGVEGFDPRFMPLSAGIRYTVGDQWLLIKGKSRNAEALIDQFPALARELSTGTLAKYFAGPEHCEGCRGIAEAANGEAGFGSLGVWRRLGTIHHLTLACQQVQALTWP